VSLAFAEACDYINSAARERSEAALKTIIAQSVHMIENAPKWLLR
jgi:hypothetical protein